MAKRSSLASSSACQAWRRSIEAVSGAESSSDQNDIGRCRMVSFSPSSPRKYTAGLSPSSRTPRRLGTGPQRGEEREGLGTHRGRGDPEPSEIRRTPPRRPSACHRRCGHTARGASAVNRPVPPSGRRAQFGAFYNTLQYEIYCDLVGMARGRARSSVWHLEGDQGGGGRGMFADVFADPHRAEAGTAHATERGGLECLLGQGLIVHPPGRLGIQGQPELLFPVEGIPGAAEGVVAVAGAFAVPGQVGG